MNDLIGLTQCVAGCTHKSKSLWVCISLTHRAPNDDLHHLACHYDVCSPHIDLETSLSAKKKWMKTLVTLIFYYLNFRIKYNLI